jgi:hypothetical protein
MSPTIRAWIYGLISAMLGGVGTVVGGAAGSMAAGITPFDRQFWVIVGGAAIVGAITNTAAYLKQSPLKPD